MSTLMVVVNGVEYDLAPVVPPQADHLTTGVFAFDRQIAEAWLRLNHQNRSLRENSSDAQGRDMKNEEWDINGETIILSRPLLEGEMEGVPAGTVVVLDGQHRLTACADSGAVFVSAVSWGVDPATRRSIDSGMSRTIQDALGLLNVKHRRPMGTLLRRQVMWNSGRRKFQGGSVKVTNVEMLNLYESDEHQALARAIEVGVWVSERQDGFPLCPPTAAAHAHYLLHKIDGGMATEFLARLRDGNELTTGHPVRTLRQRFMNDANAFTSNNPKGNGKGRRRVATHQPLGYIFRAWNAYRADETTDRILQTAEMDVPEPK